jgi:hypothetical protein
LFDRPPGEQRKAAGQDRVLDGEPEEWKDAAYALLINLIRRQEEINSDDVRQAADAAGLDQPHHPNCWGALFGRAAKAGVIERSGFTKSTISSCHARTISIWRRT